MNADMPDNKVPPLVLRFVGLASIACAGLGFWYNGSSIGTDLSGSQNPPYFAHFFYAMSAICLACYTALLYVGIQFLRLKTAALPLLVGVVLFEIAYFFATAMAWPIPGIGDAAASATGVANGGLMFQAIIAFPLWGPLAALWAKRRIKEENAQPVPMHVQIAKHYVDRPSDWVLAVISSVFVFFLSGIVISTISYRTLSPASSFLLIPLLAFGIPFALAVLNTILSVRKRRKHRLRKLKVRQASRLAAGICPYCEYDLRGLPEPRCPECGQPFDPNAVIPLR